MRHEIRDPTLDVQSDVFGPPRHLALGGTPVQDPRRRGGSHRRRQGRGEWRARETREAAAARRSAPRPAGPIPVRADRARPRGAPWAGQGRGRALRRGSRWETPAREARPAAEAGTVAALRGQGPADQETATGDREAREASRRLKFDL